MRSDIATFLAFGLSICSIARSAPTYSCFNPPGPGMTNPFGEGLEDVIESACCELLTDDSDMLAGREVVWDPLHCHHGGGEDPYAEAALCRAHDTDGCRFCRDSCVGFEGLCVSCDEIYSLTSSPTMTPPDVVDPLEPDTPAPVMIVPAPTEAPFDIFPGTSAPVTPSPVVEVVATEAPVVEECECVDIMSEEEQAVLARRSKRMVCDPTCSEPIDPVWGVLNCDYFALGQNCRACSDLCIDQGTGTWLDQDNFPCKPCSAV